MKIKNVTKRIIDVFLDLNTTTTGWEPNCWLRLQNNNGRWSQTGGVRIPSWQFKLVLESIPK